jgi:transcriptional regulator with XRE-family HTH domain
MPSFLPADAPTKALEQINVGARLRVIREQNGLSQRELAKRSSVTHSSLSMIEQGQNSPSIHSLEKILSGIPMTLAHFFVCDPSQINQIVYRSGELALIDEQNFGILAYDIPHKNSALGADTGLVPLISNRPMSGFVVSGQLEITANMQVSTLNADDVFTLPVQNAYRLRNLSALESCVLLVCAA